MPLDPVSRRELQWLRRVLVVTLGLLSNPLLTAWHLWLGEPSDQPRPKRRVHVSADGSVTHMEIVQPDSPRG